MKVYPKNSFDRFGDDLNEEILQYLTFEDKIRLECVSKQWQRCVFKKQYVIEIRKGFKPTQDSLDKLSRRSIIYLLCNICEIRVKTFESVLKKCPNIIKVNIQLKVNSKVLSLIGQYCHHIRSLKLSDISFKDVTFFRDNGHKLEELILMAGNFGQIYKYCPNVKKVFAYNLSWFSEVSEILPNNVEQINTKWNESCFSIEADNIFTDCYQLEILADKCSQTLKILNIRFLCTEPEKQKISVVSKESIKEWIDCITRFENLQSLTLGFYYLNITEPIDDCLSLIGQKCNKLLKLDVTIGYSVAISEKLLDVFSEFKAIKKLKIFAWNKVLPGSVKCFKHCKQLNELDIKCNDISEDFFANIASFVPKLKSLKISPSFSRYSDSCIKPFDSMENIEKVTFDVGNRYAVWYFGKCLSNEMSGPFAKYVVPVNDNCGYIIFC